MCVSVSVCLYVCVPNTVFSPGPPDKNDGGKVIFMPSHMICSHRPLPHKDLLYIKFLLTWYSSVAASQIYGKP